MTLGSFYFCLKSLRGGGKGDWLGYFLFTVGLCYTHNYWVFLVLAQHLYVLLFYRTEKPLLIRWTGIHVGSGLMLPPLADPPAATDWQSDAGGVLDFPAWDVRPHEHCIEIFRALRLSSHRVGVHTPLRAGSRAATGGERYLAMAGSTAQPGVLPLGNLS